MVEYKHVVIWYSLILMFFGCSFEADDLETILTDNRELIAGNLLVSIPEVNRLDISLIDNSPSAYYVLDGQIEVSSCNLTGYTPNLICQKIQHTASILSDIGFEKYTYKRGLHYCLSVNAESLEKICFFPSENDDLKLVSNEYSGPLDYLTTRGPEANTPYATQIDSQWFYIKLAHSY